MNKNNLTKGLFTALLLASSVVNADEKYPAADFQPSVVYQDDAYIKNNASTQTAVKNAAPAVASAPVVKHEVDSQYPAADFQPTVVFSDPNYKHDKSVPASKNAAKTSSASTDDVQTTVAEPADKKKEDSSATYLLGLVGLAAVGFFLFRKQDAAPATKKAAAPVAASARVAANTGVAKYLNKVSGTGVSRYVENQVKTAKSATGVAKYVAQKTLADKARDAEEAEKKATSVTKYIRNRG